MFPAHAPGRLETEYGAYPLINGVEERIWHLSDTLGQPGTIHEFESEWHRDGVSR